MSALLDPRFGARESGRAAGIEAVPCAPVGEDPPIAVVYLAGRSAGPGAWSDEARIASDATRDLRGQLRLEEVIGRSAALASVLRQASWQEATRRFQRDLLRTRLEAKGWSVTATAESLDLVRAHGFGLARGSADGS